MAWYIKPFLQVGASVL